MKSIAVYCGSGTPKNPEIVQQTRNLGHYLAENDITLIYGGARIGIMGVLAQAVLEYDGHAIGVMPHVLVQREILHPDLSEVYQVETMHERKAKMMELADAFVALPGGCGTMEEIFEVITWSQIGIHTKPFAFLNIDHYYDGIQTYLNTALEQNLTSQANMDNIAFPTDIYALLAHLHHMTR